MFNYILSFFLMIVISSCVSKTISNNEPHKTTATASASPVAIQETKTDTNFSQNKPTSNWPKVDAYDCKGNKEVREIHIELTAPSGCKLWYSNHSKSEPIAWSKNGLTYCEKINQNIRHNLENAGYVCTPKDANKSAK